MTAPPAPSKTFELLVSGTLIWLVNAWVVMLALGKLHAEIPAVPAFGYGAVLLITAALDCLVSAAAWSATGGHDERRALRFGRGR